jgi:hypothetical protein
MFRSGLLKSLLLVCLFLATTATFTAPTSSAQLSSLPAAPFAFEPNKGQAPSQYQFLARHSGVQTFYFSDGVDAFVPISRTTIRRLQIRWAGANPKAGITAEQPLPGRSNYLRGSNEANWLRNIPQFGGIRYRQIYPGIDALFHGAGELLEHDFILRPGADPNQIVFRANYPARLAPSGDLEFHLGDSIVHLHQPIAYQEAKSTGVRTLVTATYVIAKNGDLSFALGEYDHHQSLVIDPVFVFSSYLAGTTSNQITAVTTDSTGNIYLTGYTNSTDFPTTNGSSPLCPTCMSDSNPGFSVAFVSKLDPTGHTLLFSTYLTGGNTGGGFGTMSSSIAVDGTGNIFVSGVSSSHNFPQAGGVLPFSTPNFNANYYFVVSIKPDGSAFNYSGYVGGQQGNQATNFGKMVLDSHGNAYLTGSTYDANFQLTSGTLSSTPTHYPNDVLFVLKLDPTGKLVYSTLVPGNATPVQGAVHTNNFAPSAILVDLLGQVTIGGTGGAGLPTTPGVLLATVPTPPNSFDPTAGFLLQLNANASALNFATYVPGADVVSALAVNSAGNLYITGFTGQTNLPVSANAFQKSIALGANCVCNDGYIMKVDGHATTVMAATYLGGTPDIGNGGTNFTSIALDSNLNVVVGGITASDDFPLKNPLVSTRQTSFTANDLILAKMNPDLSSLLFGSFLNASEFNQGSAFSALAIDTQDHLLVAGQTYASDFPTTPNTFEPTPPPPPTSQGAYPHAFIAKLDLSTPAPSVCVAPASIDFGAVLVNTSTGKDLTVTNCGNAALQISSVAASLPNVTAAQSCGSVAPGADCVIHLTFTPTTADPVGGSITLTDNAPISHLKVGFTGKGGTPQVLFPPSFTFSDLLVGTSAGFPLFLNNNGDGDWIISNITATGDVTLDTSSCVSPIHPPIPFPGAAPLCYILINFAPKAAGLRTGTLTITDNVPGGPHVIALAGNGLLTYPTPSIGAVVAAATDKQPQTLVITGTNFFPGSQVIVNGSPRATHYSYQELLLADATSADLDQVGELTVTVTNPAPGGGVSNTYPWTIYSAIRNIDAKQWVYEPKSGLIYGSISAQSQNYTGQVIAVDPASSTVVHAWGLGNGPNQLAVSDDGQFLYVGLDGDAKVAQVTLPAGTVNFTVGLGNDPTFHNPLVADALQVLPGHPHTWAVTLCGVGFVPCGVGIAVFDDTVMRANAAAENQLQPDILLSIGQDASTLYGTTLHQIPSTTYKFAIDNTGITEVQEVTNFDSQSPGGTQLDSDGTSIYVADGQIVDPATLTIKGTIPGVASRAGIKVEAAASRVYFAGQNSSFPPVDGLVDQILIGGAIVQAFDLKSQQLLGVIHMNEGTSPPTAQLFRWGISGLAIASETRLLMMRTSLTGATVAGPQFTVTQLSPQDVPAGSADLPIVISGTGFVGGDTVSSNATPLQATVINSSEIDATVPAALIALQGSLPITVTTPGNQIANLVLVVGPTASLARFSATTLDFDSVLIGTNSNAQSLTITNAGSAPLVISNVNTVGQYSQTNNCATLALGASCSVSITFSPTSAGGQTGNLIVTDNSPGSPHVILLQGTAGDLQIAPGGSGGSSTTVSAGKPASYALTITPQGLSGQVGFSCTGLPQFAACAITPPTATLSGNPLNVSVTISTAQQQTAQLCTATSTTFAGFSWLGLLLLALLWPTRRLLRASRPFVTAVLALLALCATGFALAGCGGGSSSTPTPTPTTHVTPQGTYTVNFVATSPAGSRTLPLTLIVQ